MEYTVNHYPEKHRFEVVEDGSTAYVEYRLRGDALDIILLFIETEKALYLREETCHFQGRILFFFRDSN